MSLRATRCWCVPVLRCSCKRRWRCWAPSRLMKSVLRWPLGWRRLGVGKLRLASWAEMARRRGGSGLFARRARSDPSLVDRSLAWLGWRGRKSYRRLIIIWAGVMSDCLPLLFAFLAAFLAWLGVASAMIIFGFSSQETGWSYDFSRALSFAFSLARFLLLFFVLALPS